MGWSNAPPKHSTKSAGGTAAPPQWPMLEQMPMAKLMPIVRKNVDVEADVEGP